jgi:hypothetical protein
LASRIVVPTRGEELDDGGYHAREHQLIPGLKEFVGRHGCQDSAPAVDFHQEQPGKLSQAGLFHSFPRQRAIRLHEHGGDVFAPAVAKDIGGIESVGQEPGGEPKQVHKTHGTDR